MAVPRHLTTDIAGLDFASLLSDWQWLLKGSYTPVLMTAFGDVFLRDEAGHIHLLDLMSGEFKQVAVSQEEFDRLCDDREQRRIWFIGFLAMELRKLHGDLPARKCWSCEVPLSLGGSLEASNFQPCDIQVHYSMLGQLHQQTKHLPAGTKISDVRITEEKPKTVLGRIRGLFS